MFNSIRFKIPVLFIAVNIFTIAVIGFLFGARITDELEYLFEKNAMDQLESIYSNIITQHQSIVFHKESVFQNRKQEIKDHVEIALSSIRILHKDYVDGNIDQEFARSKAIDIVKNSRYMRDIGYFWINDTGRPYPKMVMHPTIPDLDNKILDSPDFNYARENENLFKVFVDITSEYGEGFVTYLWPKPTSNGLSEIQPKISFVKLFEPWQWIIGSGIYIDDIDKEEEKRLNKVIEELKEIMKTLFVGEYGYFFIFNSDGDMLVHPSLVGENINSYPNPETGNPITHDLIDCLNNGDGELSYLWDRPGSENNFVYRKKSFVKYYEPLDWYIASSLYLDDQMREIYKVIRYIVILSLFSIVIIIILSLLLSGYLIKPLFILMNYLDDRDSSGIPLKFIPEIKSKEFNDLRVLINTMLESIIVSKNILEKHKEELKRVVKERTLELENSIEQLKATQNQLIESEKLASLAGLVSGVAHEINTPLGISVTAASYLELQTNDLLKKYKKGKITKSLVESYFDINVQSTEMIQNNLRKASELIKTFKLMAADQESEEKRDIFLGDFIRDIIGSLQSQLKDHEIEIDIDPNLKIFSYPGVISLIFVNLVMNSIVHGFKDDSNGKIYIKAQQIDYSVEITYRDNGVGISSEFIDKIFDPFFTTNRAKGSKGLGLNIIYNHVYQKLKGTINVDSKSGEFFEIKLIFPV